MNLKMRRKTERTKRRHPVNPMTQEKKRKKILACRIRNVDENTRRKRRRNERDEFL